MKKVLACLLIGAMTLTAFTACGVKQTGTSSGDGTTKDTDSAVTTPATTTTTTTDSGNEETPDHVHDEGIAWTVDKDNHWQLCSCGETVNMGTHILDTSILCTICGIEICDWGDSTTLNQYNDQGDCILSIEYDENGTIIYTCVIELVYDEDGNMLTENRNYYDKAGDLQSIGKTEYTYDASGELLTEKNYSDGRLTYEYDYSDGGFISITYNEDGTKVVLQYEEGAENPVETWYDADGNLLDLSYKFDAESCKDLIGTWKAEMDIADFIMEVEELDYSFKIMVTMILTDKGEISMTMEIDENEVHDFIYQMAIESIYASLEEEGISRVLADAVFKAQMGMTIPEYVESLLGETYINDILGEIPEGFTGVYYIEDGVIYAGDSWNQPLDGASFTLKGDTLVLETDDEEYSDIELVFTKVID